jgi:anti-sigma factor RsiW
MIGHLGARASALLDGQLSPEETERAWEHVHSCHTCRDRVEREGWVKSRLAGLSFDVAAPPTPDWLKGSLLGASVAGPPGEAYLAMGGGGSRRRGLGLAALGGGAVGAAVMGVLVLGAAPADAPSPTRPVPASSIINDAPRTPPPSVPAAATLSRKHAR